MSTDIWNLKPRKIKQDSCHGSHGEVLITRDAEEAKQVSCQMCGRKFHVTQADVRGYGVKWKRIPNHSPKKS